MLVRLRWTAGWCPPGIQFNWAIQVIIFTLVELSIDINYYFMINFIYFERFDPFKEHTLSKRGFRVIE